MQLCKLFKCYSYHFLISLSISDLEILAKRVSVLYAVVHAVRKYGLSLIFRLNKRLEERIWTDFPTANLPDPRKFTGVIWVKEEVCGRRNARVVGKISFLLSLLPRLSLSRQQSQSCINGSTLKSLALIQRRIVG